MNMGAKTHAKVFFKKRAKEKRAKYILVQNQTTFAKPSQEGYIGLGRFRKYLGYKKMTKIERS